MKFIENECEKCICKSCINQPVCSRSCELCKTIQGYVSFCANECRCEQIELSEILKKKESVNSMDKCCGTCKWHKFENISDGFVCVNSDSDYCADWTEYCDSCEEWEKRNE